MENPKPTLSRSTVGFGLSLAVSAIFNGLLVIAKELSPNRVLPWMRNLTGHHWTTHCLLVLVVFIVLGLFLARGNRSAGFGLPAGKLPAIIVSATLIGILTIAGFYLIVG